MFLQRLRERGGVARRTGGRLTAVFTGNASGALDTAELRQLCERSLPPYMVPQQFVQIDEMPVTTAGKIDRRSLAGRCWAMDAQQASPIEAPANAVEQALADIWSEVLGIDELGTHENFFELGGDSLLIIRILSRAARLGIRLSPDAFFAYPTIAEQARLAQVPEADTATPAQTAGPLPLLPIQHWFFDTVRTDRHHWNQSMLFATEVSLRRNDLEWIVATLLDRHDALRTSYVERDGAWQAKIDALSGDLPISVVSLDAGGPDGELIESHAAELNASFDLSVPPLIRFAWFDGGVDSRLLVVAHHLIVDAVSWQILVDDLEQLLRCVAAGRETAFPDNPVSIASWCSHLQSLANDTMPPAERRFWRDYVADISIGPSITNGDAHVVDTEGDCRSITACLDADVSAGLQQDTLSSMRASLNEALISAMARVIAAWTASAEVTLDMEGHGRASGGDEPDVSGTVGWLTSLFPVWLRADEPGAWHEPVAALRIVKEQLHALPRHGLGYGLLRYLSDEVQAPQTQVLFNYLGRYTKAGEEDRILRLVDDRCGPARSPRCERSYALEVNASVVDGVVRSVWTFNPARFADGAIEQAAADFNAALAALVEAAADDVQSAVTPSDFPLAGLSQQELDSVSTQLESLDDD